MGRPPRRVRRRGRGAAGARRPLRRHVAEPGHGRAGPRHAADDQALPRATSRARSRCRSASAAASSSRDASASATRWSRCDDRSCTRRSGAVTLTVGDLDAQAAFYRRRDRPAGAAPRRRHRGTRRPGRGRAARPARRPTRTRRRAHRRTTGLFHLALLVPSRAELARALHRVSARGHRGSPARPTISSRRRSTSTTPKGNGIEIYRDRPRDEWKRAGRGAADGDPAARPRGRARERAGGRSTGDAMPAGTTIGHVHLQVALDPRRRTTSTWAGSASSRSCVGIRARCSSPRAATTTTSGLNTWAGEGAPAPPPGRARAPLVHDRAPGRAALSDATGPPPPRPGSSYARDGRLRPSPTRQATGRAPECER